MELLADLFRATIARIDPAARVREALSELAWATREPVIIAAGKSARAMARGAIEYLSDARDGSPTGLPGQGLAELPAPRGVIIAPLAGEAAGQMPGSEAVQVMVAGHPVPDARSVAAARAALELAREATGEAGALALISGGASALMELPAPGLSLDEVTAAVGAVAASGADIASLNIVRKHLSAIKGGQLAALFPVPVVTLVASDVVGDDLASVGSGPTMPDPSTFGQACDIAARATRWIGVPAAVREHLERGAAGDLPETPARARPGDRAVLVAGTGALIDAACACAGDAGMPARVFARDSTGDVADIARRIAAQAHRVAATRSRQRRCFVAGGEATIALRGDRGIGGRAQHAALLVARDIAGLAGVSVLIAGSDGIDGASDAAGAVIDGSSWQAMVQAGIDPDAALAGFDSNTALRAIGADLVTGPTGVNHADLYIVMGS